MVAPQELRKLKNDELRLRLQETRRELFNLRQQWYAGSLSDHNRLRSVRKEIARILTILHEQETKADIAQKGEVA